MKVPPGTSFVGASTARRRPRRRRTTSKRSRTGSRACRRSARPRAPAADDDPGAPACPDEVTGHETADGAAGPMTSNAVPWCGARSATREVLEESRRWSAVAFRILGWPTGRARPVQRRRGTSTAGSNGSSLRSTSRKSGRSSRTGADPLVVVVPLVGPLLLVDDEERAVVLTAGLAPPRCARRGDAGCRSDRRGPASSARTGCPGLLIEDPEPAAQQTDVGERVVGRVEIREERAPASSIARCTDVWASSPPKCRLVNPRMTSASPRLVVPVLLSPIPKMRGRAGSGDTSESPCGKVTCPHGVRCRSTRPAASLVPHVADRLTCRRHRSIRRTSGPRTSTKAPAPSGADRPLSA